MRERVAGWALRSAALHGGGLEVTSQATGRGAASAWRWLAIVAVVRGEPGSQAALVRRRPMLRGWKGGRACVCVGGMHNIPNLPTLRTTSAGSGTIDVKELKTALNALGQTPTEEELFVMISQVRCRARATRRRVQGVVGLFDRPPSLIGAGWSKGHGLVQGSWACSRVMG